MQVATALPLTLAQINYRLGIISQILRKDRQLPKSQVNELRREKQTLEQQKKEL